MKTERHDFPAGGGRCAAWVRTPARPGPHPAVVLVHGFGATHEMALPRYERRFADEGFVVVSFDYRNIGASPGEPRQLFRIPRMLEDTAAAVRFARSRSDVDPERVALWGTSLGANHVVATAARDRRIAAGVLQCPTIAGGQTIRAAAGHLARVAWPVLDDLVRRALRRGPRYVAIVGSPDELAFVNRPGAREGYLALVPDGTEFDNRANASVILDFLRYRADGEAAHVRCPLLVCVSERENLAGGEAATVVAQRAPRGEAIHYDADHWEIYHPPLVHRMLDDQVAFLRRHLQPARRESISTEVVTS